MGARFGILVFPNVRQRDLTGPYEIFASAGTPREARPEILAATKSGLAASRMAREAIIERVISRTRFVRT
jgi:hypothetical protein